MPVLADLLDALRTGRVEVVDLTAPLHRGTPILQLPPAVREHRARSRSRRSAATTSAARPGTGTTSTPASTPAPTSTRPIHWITGRDGADVVAGRRPPSWSRPAAVLDFAAEGADDPDFLLEVDARRGVGGRARPAARRRLAALPHRLGRARRATRTRFLNANETGPHTPGISVECARWLAEETPLIGVGVETVGTDAGAAHSFDPPFPCHSFLLGAGKYGLTQLRNLARLPPTGRGGGRRAAADRRRLRQPGAGAGPGRAREPVSRGPCTVAEAVGRALAALGVGHAFGVVGSGNFHVTNALVAAGVPFVAARHEGGAATMADAYARTSGRLGGAVPCTRAAG